MDDINHQASRLYARVKTTDRALFRECIASDPQRVVRLVLPSIIAPQTKNAAHAWHTWLLLLVGFCSWKRKAKTAGGSAWRRISEGD